MTAPAFTHVLMTRFNLATPGRESDLRNRPGWLAQRFDLFERYCLPAIAAQTRRDFHWVIYFDKDTPAEFKARIADLRGVFPFTPFFTGLFPTEGWRQSLDQLFPQKTPMLLTTRLDNDDALSADFTARLHAAMEGIPPRSSLNFTQGYVLSGPALYRLTHRSNPFFSWYEPWAGEALTAPGLYHTRIAAAGPVRQIGGPGAWLQTVHGGNVSNKVCGRRIGGAELAGRFPPAIMAQVKEPSRSEALLQNALLGPARDLRDGLSHLLQPLIAATLRRRARAAARAHRSR